jgi:hypothetical protein
MNKEAKIETLGETENYVVWVSQEPDDDEQIYHLELGNITIHLFAEEWEEFVSLMMAAMR